MMLGRWRVRPRWHRRTFSGLWMDRTRFPEGTVYRAAMGLFQITVMVDCMSEQERRAVADKLLNWLSE